MLGGAAVVIWYDLAPAVRAEFEDWHTHEHLPERLAIPGFLRGSRWSAADGGEACFNFYETRDLAVLTGAAYLERLNHPTPWSQRMMPHHRGMVRSLCDVRATRGSGMGRALLTLRFSPQPQAEARLLGWLSNELLPALASRRGLAAAHLLVARADHGLAQTAEQKIRGRDGAADWVVLAGGYDQAAVDDLPRTDLAEPRLVAHGAQPGAVTGLYRLCHALVPGESSGAPPT